MGRKEISTKQTKKYSIIFERPRVKLRFVTKKNRQGNKFDADEISVNKVEIFFLPRLIFWTNNFSINLLFSMQIRCRRNLTRNVIEALL